MMERDQKCSKVSWVFLRMLGGINIRVSNKVVGYYDGGLDIRV